MSLLGQGPLGQRDVKPEKFGPQADLCRRTECAMCWWLAHGLVCPPAYASPTDPKPMGGWKSQAHHEPSRGRGGTDVDTVPLCPPCHLERTDSPTAALFWGHCDWTKVRDEMRRRCVHPR